MTQPTNGTARLALADGSIFDGIPFGAVNRGIVSVAEVVFNTAMSGYQESLTDPSYTGQILVQTFPLIGNTGANPADEESPSVQVAGLVIRELARRHSNFRATESLSDYLARFNVLGIAGVDTRDITLRLRSTGSINGVLTDRADLADHELVRLAASSPSMAGLNLVPRVGCRSGRSWSETLGEWAPPHYSTNTSTPDAAPLRVLALDCGAKSNILRNLASRGCSVSVIPHDITAPELLAIFDRGDADGLFISNGPGDPAAVDATIRTLREVLSRRGDAAIPTFGICLGHQLLALALGASTYKLKFGHRGINQPVRHEPSGRVEITSQNHGFAVDLDSLKRVGGEATHIHLNDGTLAGFKLTHAPVFSVQYHPEASPGPHDAGYLFDDFITAMKSYRSRRPAVSVGR
jgi:carbamoyl-phosphate synthase small subunit